jgi:uncharacterized sulfatase
MGLGSELDLLQTFASLAGSAAPADRPLDGHDLSRTLREGAPSPRDTVYYYGGTLVAIRRDSYKLHLQPPGQPQGGRGGAAQGAEAPTPPAVQLYNLDIDPSEQFDLATDRPEVVAELTRLAEAHIQSVVPGPSQLGRGTGGGRQGGRGRQGTPGGGQQDQ